MTFDDEIKKIQDCKKCIEFEERIDYPVFSFGNPECSIWFIGINPRNDAYGSDKNGNQQLFRHEKWQDRHEDQLSYFDDRKRNFFEDVGKFLGKDGNAIDVPLQEAIGWKRHPWEKVAFLDVVKCPTKSLWSRIEGEKDKTTHMNETQEKFYNNCKGHLDWQISHYKPDLVFLFGKPAKLWCMEYFNQKDIKNFTTYKLEKDNHVYTVISVPQNAIRTGCGIPVTWWLKNWLLKHFNSKETIPV